MENNAARTNERLEVVKDALKHWDPIGVIDLLIEDDLPPDEYDSYAPSVLSLVQSGADAKAISNYLTQIRTSSMSLDSGKASEHEEEIGEKLAVWRESDYQRKPDFRFTRYAF